MLIITAPVGRPESIIQRARCRRGHKRPSTRAAPAPRGSSARPRPTSLITEALSAGAEAPAVRSRSTDPIASTCPTFKFSERPTRLMPSDPDNSGSIFIDKSRAKINGGDVNLDRSDPAEGPPFRDLLDDASRCHRGWAYRACRHRLCGCRNSETVPQEPHLPHEPHVHGITLRNLTIFADANVSLFSLMTLTSPPAAAPYNADNAIARRPILRLIKFVQIPEFSNGTRDDFYSRLDGCKQEVTVSVL